jgi:hypothetical protein
MDVVSMCRDAYPDMNIISAAASERDDCCRIISTDGHILRPDKGRLIDEGYLLSMPREKIAHGFNEQKNGRVLHQTYMRI